MKEILTYGFPDGNPADDILLISIVNGLLNFLCGKPSEGVRAEEWFKPLDSWSLPGEEIQHFWRCLTKMMNQPGISIFYDLHFKAIKKTHHTSISLS